MPPKLPAKRASGPLDSFLLDKRPRTDAPVQESATRAGESTGVSAASSPDATASAEDMPAFIAGLSDAAAADLVASYEDDVKDSAALLQGLSAEAVNDLAADYTDSEDQPSQASPGSKPGFHDVDVVGSVPAVSEQACESYAENKEVCWQRIRRCIISYFDRKDQLDVASALRLVLLIAREGSSGIISGCR
ncbi:MAG: hypothetical protein Q9162_007523 [Coniocarpon cinnabarinum]